MKQTDTNLIQILTQLGILQQIKFWPYEQSVYAQTGLCPRKREP